MCFKQTHGLSFVLCVTLHNCSYSTFSILALDFIFSSGKFSCTLQQNWTCELSHGPLPPPVLEKVLLVCTWWLGEKSCTVGARENARGDGDCAPQIPNALHSPSPLTFLLERFNTNTNKETAEAIFILI